MSSSVNHSEQDDSFQNTDEEDELQVAPISTKIFIISV